MRPLFFFALPLIACATPVLALSRFPDFRAKCMELAQAYNGADNRVEMMSFKNFQGHQQDLELRLKLKEEECSYSPDQVHLKIQKVGGSQIDVMLNIAVNPEATGGDRLYVSSFMTTCETVSAPHLVDRLSGDGVVINETLKIQISSHVKNDFCPIFAETVKTSVLNALNAM